VTRIIIVATRIQNGRSKNQGSILPASTSDFSRFHSAVIGYGAQPPIQWIKEILSLGDEAEKCHLLSLQIFLNISLRLAI
jgi:hypothetical protein